MSNNKPLHVFALGEIRAHMARERITASRLGELLGVNTPWVTRRLNGQVSLTLEELEKICAALGIPVSDVLCEPETGASA